MDAALAGLLAWTIELSITIGLLLVLRREERKVIARRREHDKT
jgi:hypothetical protein